METVDTLQKLKLITDLTKSIGYWTTRNPEYANAYMMLLHGFSAPSNISQNDENIENVEE